MDIRYCRMCGAKVDENDDVCPRCGVKVTSPKTMKKKSSSKRNRIISFVIFAVLVLVVINLAFTFFPQLNEGIFPDSNSNRKIDSDFINDFMNNSSSNSKNYIPVNSSDDSNSSDVALIGNAESKRFHRSDCYLISQIQDSNRIYFSSHDSAVSSGYTPCGDCNP